MHFRLLIALVAAAATGACASPPVTREALEAAQPVPVKVCSTFDVEQAVSRLRSAWEQCFSGPAGFKVVPTGASVVAYRSSKPYVTESQATDLRTLYARFSPKSVVGSAIMGSQTVLLMADFRHTAMCNTEITARGWNDGWQTRAAHTAAWLDNPQDSNLNLCD
jgi:hypothetical protein